MNKEDCRKVSVLEQGRGTCLRECRVAFVLNNAQLLDLIVFYFV